MNTTPSPALARRTIAWAMSRAIVTGALCSLVAGTALAQDGDRSDPERTGTYLDSGAPRLSGDKVRSEGRHRAWAQIQTWVTVADQDTNEQADPNTYGDPEADPGFSMPRGRLGLDGVVGVGDLPGQQQLDYSISFGIGTPFDRRSNPVSPSVQVVDAVGRYTVGTGIGPYALSVGIQRVPFNRDTLISSNTLVFQERTIASSWLAPTREVGAVAAQAVDLGDGDRPPQILLRAGVFNGNGSFMLDDDPGMLTAARLELAMGDAYRTWSWTRENALGIGVAVLNNNEIALNTTSLVADLLARVKVVTLSAEVIQSRISLDDTAVAAPAVKEGTDRLSMAGQLSVWIPIEDQHGIEVAGRFQQFDDATTRDDAGDVQIVHAGLTWRRPLPSLDLGGGYIMRLEPNISAIKNDTVRLWVQLTPGVVL